MALAVTVYDEVVAQSNTALSQINKNSSSIVVDVSTRVMNYPHISLM